MSRSKWKAPYCNISMLEVNKTKVPIKVYSRSSTILPIKINKIVLIHNGQKYIPLTIKSNMIGHKFGEFALTRAIFSFGKKEKKKEQKKESKASTTKK